VTVAQGRNALYAPSGCQSFEHGSTVRVDTETGEKHRITYRYGDQGVVAVDPHDPRRVFITTSDAAGDYDSEQWLTLHMLYDDVIVASLPLQSGFGSDNKRLLRDMVFDPASSRLFISLGPSILVVDVGGVPPAEMWPVPVTSTVTPDQGGEVKAPDGSATFYLLPGDVDHTTQVTYTEKAPLGCATSTARALTTEKVLRPVRTFELTGVISGTNTALESFNDAFTLHLQLTDKELAGVIDHTLSLYWWDGDAWQAQSSVSDVPVGSTSASYTGCFALMGESYAVYLPVLLR
jgi:hypothetical protein